MHQKNIKIILIIVWVLRSISTPMASNHTQITIAAFSMPTLSSDGFYRLMAEKLEKKENGSFKVKLLIRGELGSDESHFYALRRGRIEIAGVGFQSVSTAIPELSILNAAYLFNSWEEFDYVYEKSITPYINNLLEEKGIVGIRHFGASWHGIYSKKPINIPSDVKEKRFRALIDPASQLFVKALLADMFQIPGTEVVTALQTGLIEAGETNAHVYNITGTSIEAPYFTRTRHTASGITVLANKEWFDSLTLNQKKAVRASYPSPNQAGPALRLDEERMLHKASLRHVTIIEPDKVQLQEWKRIGVSTHKRLIKKLGGKSQELYNLIQTAKEEFSSIKTTPIN